MSLLGLVRIAPVSLLPLSGMFCLPTNSTGVGVDQGSVALLLMGTAMILLFAVSGVILSHRRSTPTRA